MKRFEVRVQDGEGCPVIVFIMEAQSEAVIHDYLDGKGSVIVSITEI